MKTWKFLLIFTLLGLTACGYHLAGRGAFLPSHIKKIGIPLFLNDTSKIELPQRLTEQVQKEFISRGKFEISSSETDVDAILEGTILSYELHPGSIDSEGRATSYTVTIRTSVVFKDLINDIVIWENENYLFREDFQISSDIEDYYNQEIEAINISAEAFAKSIVSTILEGF
jgi:outer membrane lipopolysaccharide assembly protein LptE/RlpB